LERDKETIAKLTNYASTKRETEKRLVELEAKYQKEKRRRALNLVNVNAGQSRVWKDA